jgi:hypothetical protein
MRRGAAILVAMVVFLALTGCGSGGSADPGDAVEAAFVHRDKKQGEYLLAEVEVDQAYLAEDLVNGSGRKRIREDIRDAQHTEHQCWEGNGLESCTEIEPIEAVVKEMHEELAAQ